MLGVVLGEARVELECLLEGVERGVVHRQRGGADGPRNPLGAGRGGEGPRVLIGLVLGKVALDGLEGQGVREGGVSVGRDVWKSSGYGAEGLVALLANVKEEANDRQGGI